MVAAICMFMRFLKTFLSTRMGQQVEALAS